MTPRANKLMAVAGILALCLGLYQLGQSVLLRLFYVPTEGTLKAEPVRVQGLNTARAQRQRSYVVSYEYKVGSKVYSFTQSTHDEPRDGVIDVFYRQDNPALSTVEHPDYYLVQGGFMLFCGLACLLCSRMDRGYGQES